VSKSRIVGGTLAGALALSAGPIAYYEGLVPGTYADPVGILTICYGHTGPDVKPGMVKTVAECKALLTVDQRKHWDGVERCLQRDVTVPQAAALISFSFNAGVSATCSSTMLRQLNAGAPANVWCQQMTRWVYGTVMGVKVRLPGLVKRRAAERAVCEGG
jgi:lysozyme